MTPDNIQTSRRKFLRSGVLFSFAATTHISDLPFSATAEEGLYMIGPREGYSPYIGSLVSMMNYNRHTILQLTKGLTMEQLDHLQDAQSNSIGALMMHLAAVDKIYYIMCFENRDDFAPDEKAMWAPALDLGDKGRQMIKGKDLSYYVGLLTAQRELTLKALKQKDDQWLLAYDPNFDKTERFNNYWKWFHVCEHESHHRGQIAWLKKRLPGMQDSKD